MEEHFWHEISNDLNKFDVDHVKYKEKGFIGISAYLSWGKTWARKFFHRKAARLAKWRSETAGKFLTF